MKNKKIIYPLIIISLIIIIGVIILINNNKISNTKKKASLLEAVLKNTKQEDSTYKKFVGGEVLNEDTCFREYAFISNNSIYIYNPQSLEEEKQSYKKVYDIPNNIKVMNIRPGYGADIQFIDYNDKLYTLEDQNIDNKVIDNYTIYEKANYKLSDYLTWDYTPKFLGQKINYDFISNYNYSKDNVLYFLNYGNDKYPTIEKVDGNYEGEKIIRIYNERILKTDKAFYEIIRYRTANDNKYKITTMKIKLLSDYYNEVLTFTYKYVILKDYTLIPIDDVMTSRNIKYQYNYFYSTFEETPEVFEE